MPTFDQSTIFEKTMSGDDIEHGIVKDLFYVILLRMGNGEVIEILTMDRHRWRDAMGRILWP